MRLLVSALAFSTAGGLALPNYPLPRPPSPSLAQRALDWALASPLYGGVLVPQARRTMVKTAEANAIPWAKSLAWIKGHKAWGAAELAAASDPDTVTPAYYCAPFHAYLPGGNLCWEAAWEQELAGQAVGQRNFPGAGPGGAAAEAFRSSFDDCLADLGADPFTAAARQLSTAIVDLGCGTGTSTRRLAMRFPGGGVRVLGIDLSPHMLAVAAALRDRGVSAAEAQAAARPEAEAEACCWVEAVPSAEEEPRVEFLHRDLADTRLPGSPFCR